MVWILFFLSIVLSTAEMTKKDGLPKGNWITYDLAFQSFFLSHLRIDEALETASTNNKPTMVVITRSWCGACKSLKESLAISARHFIGLSNAFNLVSIPSEEIEQQTGVRFIPTLLYDPI